MPTVRDFRAPGPRATCHELAIRKLIDSHPRMCRNGFRSTIIRLVDYLDGEEDLYPDGFMPDAYRIDSDARQILMFEVQDTNPISADKLLRLAMFWFHWDAEDNGWEPIVTLIDRNGCETGRVDLCGAYYGVLASHAPQSAAAGWTPQPRPRSPLPTPERAS